MKALGLPKKYRLTQSSIFSRLFAVKNKRRNPFFWMATLPNDQENARLGILVPKKKFLVRSIEI